MTRRTMQVTVPMGRAAGVLPRTLDVGNATLEIQREGETTSTGLGRGVSYEARWAKGSGTGRAHIDITQTSKMTAQIAVRLNSPSGFGRILWSGARLRGLAELFTHALRYQIETRASEDADVFEVRRTRADLVKARAT